MTQHGVVLVALALFIMASSVTTSAAPATAEELRGLPPDGQGQTSTVPMGTGVEHSRTVELLLQLQDQAPAGRDGVAAGGKPEAARRAAPIPPSPPTESTWPAATRTLLDLKSNLLGSGSGSDAASIDRGSREERSGERLPSSASPLPAGSRAESSAARPSLLSHPAIRFIRENRGLTIAVSLGILAAVWLGANYRSRADRR